MPKPVKEKENPLPDIPLSGMNKRTGIEIEAVLTKNANVNHRGKIKNEAEALFPRNQQFVVTFKGHAVKNPVLTKKEQTNGQEKKKRTINLTPLTWLSS